MSASPVCASDRRRVAVRASARWNGIDWVEVGDDQRTLCVHFLDRAPDHVEAANVRIDGGERIRNVRVVGVAIRRHDDPELDDCLEIVLDRPGDFSTYTLRLVEVDDDGRPTDQPLRGFDRRYAQIEFGFKEACPSALDCVDDRPCPEPVLVEPEIDYLAKDYASFRRLILDRLALVMPDWRERHAPDLMLALVEALAYTGDQLSYYQDAVGTEAYLETARTRISLRRHARLVDYVVHEGCNARAFVHVATNADLSLAPDEIEFLTRFPDAPAAGVVLSPEEPAVAPDAYEVFQPLLWPGGRDTVELFEAHNRIRLYAWGDAECCIPEGATSATLRDEWAGDGRHLNLLAGDLLLFEEVRGPKTGDEDDADASHRQVVRLTKVRPAVDPLYEDAPAGKTHPTDVDEKETNDREASDHAPVEQTRTKDARRTEHRPIPIVEVEWAPEDALRFPVCISVVGAAPECALLDEVSVARGNVILVDHGRAVGPEDLGSVEAEPDEDECDCEGHPADVRPRAKRFRPRLAQVPLTFAEPLARAAPASRALAQDARKALPALSLAAAPGADPVWRPRSDLLGSGPTGQHVVVEVDDERHGRLRFGDGDCGRMPLAGSTFAASYRVGNGPAGNVGAETILLARARKGVLGVELRPRNPLAASGGTAPETPAEVRRYAPWAFKQVLERAIVAEDYARLASAERDVQGTAASLRWTGSWYEAAVAVDARGTPVAGEELLERVRQRLYPRRRIGHDLLVRPAHTVALDLELSVCVLPEYLRGHVEAALRELFSARVLPDGTRGFFHPDSLTFGQGVYLSAIVAAAHTVPGVESVKVEKLERLFEGEGGALAAGILKLGPLEIARLDNDPSVPEYGRLTLRMRGGR